MKCLFVAVAVVGLWAAAGCTLPEPSSSTPPPGGALPPPEDLAEPGAEAGGEAAVAPAPESAAPGSTVPESAVPESGVVIESIQPDPEVVVGPTAITIPEGSGWTHPETPLTKQQEDIEACFNFASAQIARESQIDYDRYQVDSDFANLHGETTLTRRVDYYSERRRRGALFDSCMRSKGYLKN